MGKNGANVPVKRTNRLPRTNASSKVGKGRHRSDNSSSTRRSAETIQRLKMYTSGKPIRNRQGQVVAGTFMMNSRAGDREITAATGRIQPDRRWFGNTRVVSPKELDTFRQEMSEKISDPYSVVLKRKKLPMGLLQDAAEYDKKQKGSINTALLEQEPFETTFGSKSRRKRVKLDQLLIARGQKEDDDDDEEEENEENDKDDEENKDNTTNNNNDDSNAYSALLTTAQKSQDQYQEINTREGIVPWGRDHNVERKSGLGIDWHYEKKDDLFLKGQSKRIWAEFYKVIDCSDIVLHVLDARNVPGTRCTTVEKHLAKNCKHKHLIYVLNKVDLVPNWVVKRWMGELAQERPTIAFHASLRHAFGKGALISLLRQFSTLYQKDKKQISVGVIGYPNVGKSSIINTLISKKSCKVAPVPGETKIWQYITLFKRISLIDCPGIVVDDTDLEGSEVESVLKGVIRAERLENPEDYVDAICEKVSKEHIIAQYGLSRLLQKYNKKKSSTKKDDDDEEEKLEEDWKDSLELMELIARKSGRLLKGGEPCVRSAAIMLINDFQRGRLPHYVAPPELKEEEDAAKKQQEDDDDNQKEADSNKLKAVEQNLDSVGAEYANKEGNNDDDVDNDDEKDEENDNDDEEDEEEKEKDAGKKSGKEKKKKKKKQSPSKEDSKKKEEKDKKKAPVESDSDSDDDDDKATNNNTLLIGDGDWDD